MIAFGYARPCAFHTGGMRYFQSVAFGADGVVVRSSDHVDLAATFVNPESARLIHSPPFRRPRVSHSVARGHHRRGPGVAANPWASSGDGAAPLPWSIPGRESGGFSRPRCA